MSIKVLNSCTLQLITGNQGGAFFFKRLTDEEAQEYVKDKELESYVGHEDTARLISKHLGREVKSHRASARLEPYETMLVGQVEGGRLPTGTDILPEGIEFHFYLVRFLSENCLVEFDDVMEEV